MRFTEKTFKLACLKTFNISCWLKKTITFEMYIKYPNAQKYGKTIRYKNSGQLKFPTWPHIWYWSSMTSCPTINKKNGGQRTRGGRCLFLAVQNSSIGDLVTNSLTEWLLILTLQSGPRDLWSLRHLIRLKRLRDLATKPTCLLPTCQPTYQP